MSLPLVKEKHYQYKHIKVTKIKKLSNINIESYLVSTVIRQK